MWSLEIVLNLGVVTQLLTTLAGLWMDHQYTISILIMSQQRPFIFLVDTLDMSSLLEQFRRTMVICVARFSNECPSQRTGPSVLLIQARIWLYMTVIYMQYTCYVLRTTASCKCTYPRVYIWFHIFLGPSAFTGSNQCRARHCLLYCSP